MVIGAMPEMMDIPENEDFGLYEAKIGEIIKGKDLNKIVKPKKADEVEKGPKKTRKEYQDEFKEVIKEAEVLLEILDARIPSESRMKETEKYITEKGKKLILVLNKTDLVPEDLQEKWYEKLSKEYKTAIFNSLSSAPKAQTTQLAKLIHEVSDDKKSDNITVGIIGYPTVGKRTVLKLLQKTLPIEEKITILNKTGTNLIKAKEPNSVIVKSVADLEDLGDPFMQVHSIIKKVPKDEILLAYEISDYNNTKEFLECVAKKKGLLLKGGLPDYDSAGREVLKDFAQGKIRFYEDCE